MVPIELGDDGAGSGVPDARGPIATRGDGLLAVAAQDGIGDQSDMSP